MFEEIMPKDLIAVILLIILGILIIVNVSGVTNAWQIMILIIGLYFGKQYLKKPSE